MVTEMVTQAIGQLKTLLDEAKLRPCDHCGELDFVRFRRKIAGNGGAKGHKNDNQ